MSIGVLDIINWSFTGLSGLCLIFSIKGAKDSLKHANTARLIADRDNLKETFDSIQNIFKYLREIRSLLNPLNQPRAKSPIPKLSSLFCSILQDFEKLIKDIPSDYLQCLSNYMDIKNQISSFISEQNIKSYSEKRLNYLDNYFNKLQEDIKEIYSQKTKELSIKK